MIYWIGYGFWKIVSFFFFPIKCHGRRNLPKKGGFILASNHLSYLDPMLIGLCFSRRLSYVARDTLFKNKIFKFFLHQVGAFPIKRQSADVRGIKETLKRIKDGYPIVVFPEGTRHHDQKKIHGGIGLIAVKSNAPVVPVKIIGSDRVLPPGVKFPRRHIVHVHFGTPRTFDAKWNYETIASRILYDIQALA